MDRVTSRSRRWVLGAGVLAAVTPGAAAGAPIALVEQHEQFMLFDDVDGSVENAGWFARESFLEGYAQVESGLLAVKPDDSQFIVLYTTWSLPMGIAAFYQSVANDVQGIGYEHIAPEDAVIPEPYFDDTPDSQVQGLLHLNRWTQYLGDDAAGVSDRTISLIFGQELAHAWGAFVYFDQGDGPDGSILGRSNAHWSFYLHTGGSPMQGHEWIDNGDGTFTAVKPELFRFSDLDLYLMGLLPAREVAPFFLLEDPSDCFDAAAGDGVCAPPGAFQFEAESYTIRATRRDLTLDDVLAVEGPRVPAWPDAPTEFDVSFVLVKRPDQTLSDAEIDSLNAVIGRTLELFEQQTRGLGRVVNRTAGEGPPGGSDAAQTSQDGTAGGEGGPDEATSTAGETEAGEAGQDDAGGCACGQGAPPGTGWFGLPLLGLLRRRRAARRGTRGRGRVGSERGPELLA